jgi:hypothetical protein
VDTLGVVDARGLRGTCPPLEPSLAIRRLESGCGQACGLVRRCLEPGIAAALRTRLPPRPTPSKTAGTLLGQQPPEPRQPIKGGRVKLAAPRARCTAGHRQQAQASDLSEGAAVVHSDGHLDDLIGEGCLGRHAIGVESLRLDVEVKAPLAPA